MKSVWESFAAVVAKLNCLDQKPSLILTAVGQVFMNQNQPMQLNF
jgi:hypothetical protein